MAGKIIADTLEHSTAGSVTTDYVVNGSAKAWLNLDGKATTNYARDSFNVSSITDLTGGNYTQNLTNSMNNANYACTGGAAEGSAAGGTRIVEFGSNYDVYVNDPNFTTSSFIVIAKYTNSAGSAYDTDYLFTSTFGDLA